MGLLPELAHLARGAADLDGLLVALGLIVLAADGWTGGKVLGMVKEAASGD